MSLWKLESFLYTKSSEQNLNGKILKICQMYQYFPHQNFVPYSIFTWIHEYEKLWFFLHIFQQHPLNELQILLPELVSAHAGIIYITSNFRTLIKIWTVPLDGIMDNWVVGPEVVALPVGCHFGIIVLCRFFVDTYWDHNYSTLYSNILLGCTQNCEAVKCITNYTTNASIKRLDYS